MYRFSIVLLYIFKKKSEKNILNKSYNLCQIDLRYTLNCYVDELSSSYSKPESSSQLRLVDLIEK